MKTTLLLTLLVFGFSGHSQTDKAFKKQIKKFKKNHHYSWVPAGSYNIGVSDSDIPYLHAPRARTVSVDSFIISQWEVSNGEYMEFLQDLKKTDTNAYNTMLPDTLVWRMKNAYNEPFVEYYLRHPAYQNYPVVGVSYNQVQVYANWLSEHYNSNEDRVFKKVRFRLPTEQEWEYAARGGHDHAVLPWGTYSTVNTKGQIMANFAWVGQLGIGRDSVYRKQYDGSMKKVSVLVAGSTGYLRSGYMSVAGELNDRADITAPVMSYWPNDYGLYNMAGNVEEMVDAYYSRMDRKDYKYNFSHDEKPVKDPSGVTRGGSWRDTGYYIQNSIRQYYPDKDYASSEMGFRLVMEIEEF